MSKLKLNIPSHLNAQYNFQREVKGRERLKQLRRNQPSKCPKLNCTPELRRGPWGAATVPNAKPAAASQATSTTLQPMWPLMIELKYGRCYIPVWHIPYAIGPVGVAKAITIETKAFEKRMADLCRRVLSCWTSKGGEGPLPQTG